MALSRSMFKVLVALAQSEVRMTQRQLSVVSDLSLGTVNAVLHDAEDAGLVEEGRLTLDGLKSLRPYEVGNAIIMAAGLSSRLAPISYEKPKGLLRVRGEVLIERQIRQLQEAGITDITVVVGHKKEYFFYLASKFGVHIKVNPQYATRNNNYTLWLVRDRLDNTYVCSSDDYFEENPFEHYVYEAYYATQYVGGHTDEWCVSTGSGGRITEVSVGGSDAWTMLGHAYFDRAFSTAFVPLLDDAVRKPEMADYLWEDVFRSHIGELRMVARKYSGAGIHEFDTLDQVSGFDSAFIENVDSNIFDNIVSVLGCDKSQIHGFYPLKQGLTNLSCHFSVGEGPDEQEYVYRHPGLGTEKLVDRAAEEAGLRLARDLGLDNTFIYEDQQQGWKISRFVPNARPLDPHDPEQLKRAMQMCRRLHQSNATLNRSFDFVEEGLGYEKLLAEKGPIGIPGYNELKEKVLRLKGYAENDGFARCVSHNDFFYLNFLIDEQDQYSLIDWEYAGMSDEASDFGTFTVCCELSNEEAEEALQYYFGRTPTSLERRHFWSYVIFAGWCWYIWSLEKEAEGDNVGEWLLVYYRYAQDNVDRVLSWYEGDGRRGKREAS
ncbi:MAG: phosphotransferase [Olsenella sp.]|nr:phosphotransferase [Olsenella sp.]